ncbi:TlpA disulfide reductase family protein [Flectobacillus sp. DC10W]|uniref:TlpA disulfide reductase family protein n=1 Tax=Flectobacillus longus TaxID=2984207 RepID=A0ABT6YN16_9BACT|nr:TlpA disulfide reductase family protein [Flectobacillus longus]MDI9864995.1 TlpA disulfide reductase family protein [Flectobacillus longus]
MAQVDPPSIGKVCPDFGISVITPSGNEKIINLRELRGKVVILEFWATYCAPCIPSLSHFERIKKQYGNAVEIIAISDENRDKVDAFIAKRNIHNVLFGMDWGHKLNELFFHHFIPHTVVIDKNGVVKAFTAPDEIDAEIVGKLIRNQRVEIVMKQEFQNAIANNNSNNTISNKTTTVLSNANNTPNINELRISLSPYVEGKPTEFIKESEKHWVFTNCTLSLMYQILYNQKDSRVKLEVPDESKYASEPNNQYCLTVHIPESIDKSVQEVALNQLAQLFPLKAKFELRSQTVFVLEKADSSVVVSSSDSTGIIQKGLTIKDLVGYLESNPHLVNNLAVLNQTALPDTTLIDLDWFQNYNDAVPNKLKTLGLKGTEQMVDLNCLILYEEKKITKDAP